VPTFKRLSLTINKSRPLGKKAPENQGKRGEQLLEKLVMICIHAFNYTKYFPK
jgi:hypothetical protein